MSPFNSLFQSIWVDIFVAVFVLAVLVAVVMAFTYRRRAAAAAAAAPPASVFPSREQRAVAASGDGEAPFVVPRDGERPTEDDIARAELGGTRGDAQLDPAPMTPQREKKTPAHYEPGHVG